MVLGKRNAKHYNVGFIKATLEVVMAIGVFDSGVGGLSVAQKIRELLPCENLLYLADSLHAPYGEKSASFINERASIIVQFLIDQGATLIVVACNTATVSCIKELREQFSVPIVGVEPGVKTAVVNSTSKVVGIMATTQTLKSPAFLALATQYSQNVKVEVQACPGLVEQVEGLLLNDANTQALVQQYVRPLINKGADKIVLGCTHYAFLTPVIQQVAGPNVDIINTAAPVAQEVVRRLAAKGLVSNKTKLGTSAFFSSGDLVLAQRQMNRLWGENVSVMGIT
jgi:glutamate racemase